LKTDDRWTVVLQPNRRLAIRLTMRQRVKNHDGAECRVE
jgi:hypothetical protein